MKDYYLNEDIDISKISDEEIEWRLENEDYQAQEFDKKRARESITIDGRKIKNSSHARRGILGLLNKKRQKERHAQFMDNVANGNDINKIRIVTEGDSWFNYPTKLKEIIDHIFEDYSLFSLGYGGDWLANIYKEEEYLEAIRLYKPDVFIISGGGNDLVGSRRIKNVLYKFKNGKTATELINHKKFDSIVEDFKIIYKTIFDKLSEEHPDLKVICHGYDYPNLNGKEKNWFGKPMKRKGIDDISLRNEIAKIFMDTFNEMIKQLASNYPQIHYLDLRNKVPRNKWKDELHPNEEGFKLVAKLFKNKISEII